MKEKISWMFYMNRKKKNFEKYFKYYDIKNYLEFQAHVDTDKFIIPLEDKVKEYFVKERPKQKNALKKPIENKAQIPKVAKAIEEASNINTPKKRKIRKKRDAPKDEDKQS